MAPAAGRRRRDDVASRYGRGLLLLLVVGAFCVAVMPSVSEYGASVLQEYAPSAASVAKSIGVGYGENSGEGRLHSDSAGGNASSSHDGRLPRQHAGGASSSTLDPAALRGRPSDEANGTLPSEVRGNSTSMQVGGPIHNASSDVIHPKNASTIPSNASGHVVPEHNDTNTHTIKNSVRLEVHGNSTHHGSHSTNSTTYNYTTDIDLVSFTVADDFYVLFNNSAITSWMRHIQNVRSITFIGPPKDRESFHLHFREHYPQLLPNLNGTAAPRIRWIDESHWKTNYINRYGCPYSTVCQQLIKLYVFDLRTELGLDYIGDNVLIVDSDTVWSRNTTFVHPDGRAQYFEVNGMYLNQRETRDDPKACSGMDPVKFTEAITIGSGTNGPRKPTLSPYKACRRPEMPNATGARHIVHHMLFQYDVMMHLHEVVSERWNVTTLWEAFNKCKKHEFCNSRVAEYELYFAFVTAQYPHRVKLATMTNGVDYMGASAICDAEETECCRKKGVLLKGCHDHRIRVWRQRRGDPGAAGDMCCPRTEYELPNGW